MSVLECIQDDPQIQEHMSFKYVVALPLGSLVVESVTFNPFGVAEARAIPKRLTFSSPRSWTTNYYCLRTPKRI